jgi:uncharacterized protein YbjT (DUF2867 family)
MKQTLLIAGCGDVALRAAPLLQTHYRLLGMYRRPENREPLRLQGITPVYGDLDIPDSLSKISGLAHGVLHLAPPPNLGRHDTRTANKDKGSNVTTTTCVHQHQWRVW